MSERCPEYAQSTAVVLFDGVCNFCNGWVAFVLDRDSRARFRFAALQSDVGRELVTQAGRPPDLDTIVLIEGDRVFTRSTAILRIVTQLGPGWRLLSVFFAVPAAARDAVYRFVAARRYRWFGRRSTCRVPTPQERERFLELSAAD